MRGGLLAVAGDCPNAAKQSISIEQGRKAYLSEETGGR
ncbi:hypothetical protein PSP6_440253 [Paraburkholderia tropica]|nr:hypothetical protein PSP6_440253 [Paraburkholderia tropica]